MRGSDHFLLRWARLKRASDSARQTVSTAETAASSPQAEDPPDQPFDPASLPSLEQIVADTDIGAFLQSGVPADLTRAALRRAWVSDPAIRNFIGIAENQWDFNDPDGIPGFGVLPVADSAPAVVTQVFSKLGDIPEALSQSPPSAELDRSRMTDPAPAPDKLHSADRTVCDSPAKADEVEAAAKQTRTLEQVEMSSNRRRHGSALPR
jgi:Protein of unknown function (DUF3306)